MIGHEDIGQCSGFLFEIDYLFALLSRLDRLNTLQLIASRRDFAKLLLDERHQFTRLYVARNNDKGVVRGVIGVVIISQIFPANGDNLGHPSDYRFAVGLYFKGCRHKRFIEEVLRVVLIAHPAFFHYNTAFRLKILRIQREALHTIGLELDGKPDRVGRECLMVHGIILGGMSIVHSSLALY